MKNDSERAGTPAVAVERIVSRVAQQLYIVAKTEYKKHGGSQKLPNHYTALVGQSKSAFVGMAKWHLKKQAANAPGEPPARENRNV